MLYIQSFCIIFIRKRLQTIATLTALDVIDYVGHIDRIDNSIYDGAKFLMSLSNGQLSWLNLPNAPKV